MSTITLQSEPHYFLLVNFNTIYFNHPTNETICIRKRSEPLVGICLLFFYEANLALGITQRDHAAQQKKYKNNEYVADEVGVAICTASSRAHGTSSGIICFDKNSEVHLHGHRTTLQFHRRQTALHFLQCAYPKKELHVHGRPTTLPHTLYRTPPARRCGADAGRQGKAGPQQKELSGRERMEAGAWGSQIGTGWGAVETGHEESRRIIHGAAPEEYPPTSTLFV